MQSIMRSPFETSSPRAIDHPEVQGNAWAVVSVVFALVAAFFAITGLLWFLGVPPGLVAIACGLIALLRTRSGRGRRGMAIAGIWIASLALLGCFAWLIFGGARLAIG
jgi:D-alanyl-lipoteichoic acid acyltransferase DltB (MBOAT superfamily)